MRVHKPKRTKRPTAAEMRERLAVPLKPDDSVEAILQVSPEDEDGGEDDEGS